MATACHAFCGWLDGPHTRLMTAATVTVPISQSERRATATGVLTMLASGTSSQVGAGLGAHAFPVIGPAGVVAVRQFVALAVLLPLARPRVHRFTWRQWWPALTLGLVFAT